MIMDTKPYNGEKKLFNIQKQWQLCSTSFELNSGNIFHGCFEYGRLRRKFSQHIIYDVVDTIFNAFSAMENVARFWSVLFFHFMHSTFVKTYVKTTIKTQQILDNKFNKINQGDNNNIRILTWNR